MMEANYSTEIKVKRPQIGPVDGPTVLSRKKVFSNSDADHKIAGINADIYEGAKKERKKNEFNKSLYFKIFGGVALVTAGIAGFHKIKGFFRKS